MLVNCREFPLQSHKQSKYSYRPRAYIPSNDDQVDLRELLSVIWKDRWIVFSVVVFFAAASVVFALSLQNIYRSETLLAPSEELQGGGMAGMASKLGGLASLAGINFGNANGQVKVAVAVEVIKSRQFISDFIEKYDLLPVLMAVDRWNMSTNELSYNSEIYDYRENKWVREVDPPRTPKPSLWEAYEKFSDILTVSQDKNNGFVTISIEHFSPTVAQQWTELLVKEINDYVKNKDVQEAQRSIDYLEAKMMQVSIAEMRNVFYQLIEEQTKTVMLAEVRDEYIFSTIDPPVVPEQKVRPKRALICLLGVMFGGMLALIGVAAKYFFCFSRVNGTESFPASDR